MGNLRAVGLWATVAVACCGLAARTAGTQQIPDPTHAAAVAVAQSQPSAISLDPEMVKTWTMAAEPLHIAGPINFVGTKGVGVYLIATPAGHILIGGGVPGSAGLIEASIRKLGYKPEDIKIFLNNQAHFDHVGTLSELQKMSGGKVESMEGDVALLASGGKTDYVFGKDPQFYFTPVKVDHVLKDGETVELGGVKVKALSTPGHTPGCATFTMTVEDGGKTYSVVFPDGTTVNGGTRLVNDPSYPGILGDFRKTFRVLESLNPDIFLWYHDDFAWPELRARAAKEGAQAFVDPAGYKSFVAGKKAHFEELVKQEEAARPAAK